MADAKPKKDKKSKRKADGAEDANATAAAATGAEDVGVREDGSGKSKRRKTDATADATEAAGVADQDAVDRDERAKRKAAKAAAALAAAGGDESKAAADKEARKAAKRAAKAAAAAEGPTRKSPRLAAAAAAHAAPPLSLNGTHAKAKKPAAAAAAAAAVDDAPAPAAGAGADAKADPNKPDAAGNPPITQFVKNPEIVAALAARNMTHLFPIQAATFPLVSAAKDVLGRARTGTGKTLAFALPIIDRLQAADAAEHGKGSKSYRLPARRLPRVIVLLPTRELAIQVAKEFELVGTQLKTICVYGGSPYPPQEAAIRAGIDVMVGTCGRVRDLLDRNTPYLKFDKVEHIVLDEADEMLNMGFQEPVEAILQRVPRDKPDKPVQTLLFSATVPEWVNTLAKKYFRPDFQKIDLVGNSQQAASTDVTHIAIPCHWSERKSVLHDVVLVHGGGAGRTIIFTETKKEANELATDSSIAGDCQALHGDIAQNQREITLKGFRDRKFKILVATDVAARGLDIAGVELVIQAEPPRDHETYIHRSGRTGRAGQKGTCVIFYTPKQLYELQQIERRAKVKFIYATVPTAKQIVVARSKNAIAAVDNVDDAVLPYFMDTAKELIERKGDAQKALAYALAVIAGQTTAVNERSLLCSAAGWTTVCMQSKKAGEEIRTLSFVWTLIRKYLYPNDEQTDTKVKGMRFLKAKNGACFDIPSEDAAKLMPDGKKIDNFGCTFECVRDKLPELQPQATGPQGGGFGGGFGGRGGRGGGGGRGRGGGFGGGRGRGGRR